MHECCVRMQLAKENSLSALEQAIADAKKQCDEAGANECASAWDTVEELSAAIAHKKAQVTYTCCYNCHKQWRQLGVVTQQRADAHARAGFLGT